MTQTGSFLGTVDYCSPRTDPGQAARRPRGYLLPGLCPLPLPQSVRPPFARDTDIAVLQAHLLEPPPILSGVRSDLPRSLDGIITTAMAKEPGGRYATAGALASDFKQGDSRAAAHGPDATRAAPIPATLAQKAHVAAKGGPLRGRRGRLIAAAIVAVVLGVAGAAAFLATRESDGGAQHDGGAAAVRQSNRERTSNSRRRDGARSRTAVRGGFNCSISLREAGRRIESVADNRQSILQQLGSLQAPTGQADDVVTLLQRALFSTRSRPTATIATASSPSPRAKRFARCRRTRTSGSRGGRTPVRRRQRNASLRHSARSPSACIAGSGRPTRSERSSSGEAPFDLRPRRPPRSRRSCGGPSARRRLGRVLRGTPSAPASSSTRAAFAFPRSGAAATRARQPSPWRPTSSVRDAPGETVTVIRVRPSGRAPSRRSKRRSRPRLRRCARSTASIPPRVQAS